MNKKSIQQIKMLFTVAFALVLMLMPKIGQAQSARVTLNAQNTTLEQIMSKIEEQTSYLFVYNKDVNLSELISVNVESQPLSTVLSDVLKNTSIDYSVSGTNVILTQKTAESDDSRVVTGRVIDNKGVPVIGAAVTVKDTTIGASTDVDGNYSISLTAPVSKSVLLVNYLGYNPAEVLVGARTNINITLVESSVDVDAVVVTALGIKPSPNA